MKSFYQNYGDLVGTEMATCMQVPPGELQYYTRIEILSKGWTCINAATRPNEVSTRATTVSGSCTPRSIVKAQLSLQLVFMMSLSKSVTE